jgi:hypothetical protein
MINIMGTRNKDRHTCGSGFVVTSITHTDKEGTWALHRCLRGCPAFWRKIAEPVPETTIEPVTGVTAGIEDEESPANKPKKKKKKKAAKTK